MVAAAFLLVPVVNLCVVFGTTGSVVGLSISGVSVRFGPSAEGILLGALGFFIGLLSEEDSFAIVLKDLSMKDQSNKNREFLRCRCFIVCFFLIIDFRRF